MVLCSKTLKHRKGEMTMDMLKKIFPYSFQKKKDTEDLIKNVLIQLIVGIIAGVLIGVLVNIRLIGAVIGLVGGLVDLYVIVGIVLSVLDYKKLLK